MVCVTWMNLRNPLRILAVPENYVKPDNKTFQKAQKQTKVDNTLLRDAYFSDQTIHVLKQKEAHKIQVIT